MSAVQEEIQYYTREIHKGHIQVAYRHILNFMSMVRQRLEHHHPGYVIGSVYQGYMDMTYISFTPKILHRNKLKIAIVYLHREFRFELWLCAQNRKLRGEYIARLESKTLGVYIISKVGDNVDSIATGILVERPDFDNAERLGRLIEQKSLAFIDDMIEILQLQRE